MKAGVTVFVVAVLVLLSFLGIDSIEKLPDDRYVGKTLLIDKKLSNLVAMKDWYWGKKKDYFLSDSFPSEKGTAEENAGVYKVVGLHRKVYRGFKRLMSPGHEMYELIRERHSDEERIFFPKLKVGYLCTETTDGEADYICKLKE